jgi:hypothetical protein
MKLQSSFFTVSLVSLVLMTAGCGEDTGASSASGSGGAGGSGSTTSQGGAGGAGSGCAGLCTNSGFDGGVEEDFGNGLVECLCEGGAGAVAKADCEAYCDGFGVSPEKSYLGMDVVADDKCACDGTTP